MTKAMFLSELEKRLAGLPQEEIENRVEFYSEAIDDRVEEGKTEEEAIQDIGGLEGAVGQIVSETPLMTLVKERVKPKRKMSALEITLLILGFPLWFPLLIVFFVFVLVAFILIWVFAIVAYSIEAGFMFMAAMGFITFFLSDFNYLHLGFALAGIGLSILMAFGCKLVTKANWELTKGIALGIKKKLFKRGSKQ